MVEVKGGKDGAKRGEERRMEESQPDKRPRERDQDPILRGSVKQASLCTAGEWEMMVVRSQEGMRASSCCRRKRRRWAGWRCVTHWSRQCVGC